MDENRRLEDRDRHVQIRLDAVEKNYVELIQRFSRLDNDVAIVKLEQVHLKDLMDSRLRVIEKSIELQLAKTTEIGQQIQNMGNDWEKTPAGRTLNGFIRSVQGQVDEHVEKIDGLKEWQTKVDGILTVLKWMGPTGLLALVITILRMMKLLP